EKKKRNKIGKEVKLSLFADDMMLYIENPKDHAISYLTDRTCILMDTSWVLNLLSHNANTSRPFSVFGCIPKNNYNTRFTTK
ncbi:hypothetical protein PSY51_23815, partial [Shigella flexneri]|nr:hypothetical protein [Shigella flexneri]